jgi:hypothetical protein
MKMTQNRPAPDKQTDAALDGLIEAALRIASRDASIRRDLKAALLCDDLAQALRCACALVNVEPTAGVLQLEIPKAA